MDGGNRHTTYRTRIVKRERAHVPRMPDIMIGDAEIVVKETPKMNILSVTLLCLLCHVDTTTVQAIDTRVIMAN